MDESKHEIHSQVDAITAGTASVVNLTAGQWHRHDSADCPLFLFHQSVERALRLKRITDVQVQAGEQSPIILLFAALLLNIHL